MRTRPAMPPRGRHSRPTPRLWPPASASGRSPNSASSRRYAGCSTRSGAPEPQNPPITAELLRALTKADNYAGGAFDGRRAGRRVRRVLRPAGGRRPAQPHRGRGRVGDAAWRRVRAQAAPAGLGDAPRRGRRSRGHTTRWSAATRTSTWSSSARGPPSTCQLLRRHERRHQRRRRHRPAAGAAGT